MGSKSASACFSRRSLAPPNRVTGSFEPSYRVVIDCLYYWEDAILFRRCVMIRASSCDQDIVYFVVVAIIESRWFPEGGRLINECKVAQGIFAGLLVTIVRLVFWIYHENFTRQILEVRRRCLLVFLRDVLGIFANAFHVD